MFTKGLNAALAGRDTARAESPSPGLSTSTPRTPRRWPANCRASGWPRRKRSSSYREKNGPFKSADDLAKVKGLGKKLVDQNKSNLKFEAAKAAG